MPEKDLRIPADPRDLIRAVLKGRTGNRKAQEHEPGLRSGRATHPYACATRTKGSSPETTPHASEPVLPGSALTLSVPHTLSPYREG